MINSLVNGIQKLFGNKADKDVKGLEPFVGKINTEFNKLENLTNDELRGKTTSFKQQVNDYLSEIDIKIADLKSEIKNTTVHEIDKREDAYEQIDSLEE
jgi:preprotein translocase subunit SecA